MIKKFWTQQEMEYLTINHKNHTILEMAVDLSRTYNSVAHKLCSMKLTSRRKDAINKRIHIRNTLADYLNLPQTHSTENVHVSIKRVLSAGVKQMLLKDICELCEVSIATVQKAMKLYSIRPSTQSENYFKSQEIQERFHLCRSQYHPNHLKKIDRNILKLLLVEHKDITEVAQILSAPRKTIINIIYQERHKKPNWLKYFCGLCAQPFSPKAITQQYCCYICSVKGRSFLNRVERSGLNLSFISDQKECLFCGTPFIIETRYQLKQIFCTKKCQRTFHNNKRLGKSND